MRTKNAFRALEMIRLTTKAAAAYRSACRAADAAAEDLSAAEAQLAHGRQQLAAVTGGPQVGERGVALLTAVTRAAAAHRSARRAAETTAAKLSTAEARLESAPRRRAAARGTEPGEQHAVLLAASTKAAAAYRSACRAADAAAEDLSAAEAQLDHWRQQLAADAGGREAEQRAAALLDSAAEHAAAQERTAKATVKRERAAAGLRTWRTVLNRYPSERARRRATAVLLEHLAGDPVALVRAADVVLVQSSAGKDSLVALHRTVIAARAAGCLDKVVVVHCDLGEAEWPGVRDLARRQAERFGVKFIVVAEEGGFLGMVEKRGKWPDAKRRLCTSSLKRDKAGPIITVVVAELGLDEQAVVLNVMGIRAAESASRALKTRLSIDARTTSANRLVLTWNIIFGLTEREVWQEIAENALEYHPIYDTLLPRLSCVYCVLAGPDWLVLATRVCFALGLPMPGKYVALERRIGHDFKQGIRLSAVVAAARMLDALEGPLTWECGDALREHLGEEAAAEYRRRLSLAA